MTKDHPDRISSGIDALVTRLHDDGVRAGQEEAARLIASAEQDAARIREQAHHEADKLLASARKTAATEHRAAEEALQVAFRDLVLDMKNQLLLRLSDIFQQRVRETVSEPGMLHKMVLEAVSKLANKKPAGSNGDVTLLLPEEMLALKEIRDDPDRATQGALADLAFSLRDELLHSGIELMPQRSRQNGFRIALNQGQVELDISDQAIAELLLSYLQPRFQAILEGVIR